MIADICSRYGCECGLHVVVIPHLRVHERSIFLDCIEGVQNWLQLFVFNMNEVDCMPCSSGGVCGNCGNSLTVVTHFTFGQDVLVNHV